MPQTSQQCVPLCRPANSPIYPVPWKGRRTSLWRVDTLLVGHCPASVLKHRRPWQPFCKSRPTRPRCSRMSTRSPQWTCRRWRSTLCPSLDASSPMAPGTSSSAHGNTLRKLSGTVLLNSHALLTACGQLGGIHLRDGSRFAWRSSGRFFFFSSRFVILCTLYCVE
jgi:hypothetical protein